MTVNGPYVFRLAVKAIDGFLENPCEMTDGEWCWYKTGGDYGDFFGIYLACPDCHSHMTVWRRFNGKAQGHTIDAQGNISPSVLHTWPVNGVEQCGFHSIPTKLEGFVDKR